MNHPQDEHTIYHSLDQYLIIATIKVTRYEMFLFLIELHVESLRGSIHESLCQCHCHPNRHRYAIQLLLLEFVIVNVCSFMLDLTCRLLL